MREVPLKLKSASCLFAYWHDGQLRITNYLTRKTFSANLTTLELIRFFCVPRTISAALVEFRAFNPQSVAASIVRLIKAQLLLEFSSGAAAQDDQVRSSWKLWLPAGAFHFMTKDTPFVPWDWPVKKKMSILPKTRAPPQFKRMRGTDSIRLSSNARGDDVFFQTVHARRTHREFAKGSISVNDLSTLLQTTWGVQGYFQTDVFGELPYKTSPSGGSRHPGEVYLIALKVDGLGPGMYHYQADENRLVKLPVTVGPHTVSRYCAGQRFFNGAAALFVMTAVFARTMWKYRGARAYRVVLLEAGHLCQTLCLTATRLGLAPFCTAALRDTLIEKDLGLDGIEESVLYVAGVGLRAANLITARPTISDAG